MELVSAASLLVAAGAMTISLIALRDRRRSEHYSNAIDAIEKLYKEFDELDSLRAEFWEYSHLLEMEENYALGKALAIRAWAPSNPRADAARKLIQERGAANRIFSMFEKICYSRAAAERQGLQKRAEFLLEVQQYFQHRLLRNPRLRWLWAEGGGNLQIYFEDSTRAAYYQGGILPLCELQEGDGPGCFDPVGPYQ